MSQEQIDALRKSESASNVLARSTIQYRLLEKKFIEATREVRKWQEKVDDIQRQAISLADEMKMAAQIVADAYHTPGVTPEIRHQIQEVLDEPEVPATLPPMPDVDDPSSDAEA